MRTECNVILVNCRWYFGHDVQVITYYYGPSSAWCVVVYHADSNRFSVSEDSTNNDVHVFDCSSNSMYHALQKAQGKIEEVIGKQFGTEAGVGIPTINEFPARCGCQLSLTSADQEIKVRVLEVKLQALENKLRDGNRQLGHEDTTGSHHGPSGQAGSTPQTLEAILQSTESRLESIEHGMRNRLGETTIATALVEGELIPEETPVEIQNTQSGNILQIPEQLIVPIPSLTTMSVVGIHATQAAITLPSARHRTRRLQFRDGYDPQHRVEREIGHTKTRSNRLNSINHTGSWPRRAQPSHPPAGDQ